jgi:hypothetical protein
MSDKTSEWVGRAFDKIHVQLSLLRVYSEDLDDPEVTRLVESMEFGVLVPMRRLRDRLRVPYGRERGKPNGAD